jgi:uncharacterized protein involved in exopolysaccharide biosynthesis
VIGRFLEAFFRHKLLIMLPVVVLPLIVTPIAFFLHRPFFETNALIWVARPTYLRGVSDGDPWATPAQVTAGQIQQLMRTRAFIADVARRTDLEPFLATEAGEAEVGDFFARSVSVVPASTNLVSVGARAEYPQLTVQVVNALIETARDRVMSERAEQAGIAIAFYESRLRDAEAELAKATADIRRYVAANPRLTTVDPSRGAGSTTAARLGLPPIAIDPQLAELIRQIEGEQREVDNLRSSLESALMETAASAEGQDVNFRLLDSPRVPTAPVSQRRRILIFPAAGLVVGLGLSVSLLVVLVVADRSVRTAHDLPPSARIAAVVPFLQLRKLPKQAGPHSIRRAMGFVAGGALPAPQGVR